MTDLFKRSLSIAAALALLAACGQTGPLRLPEPKASDAVVPEPREAPTTGDPPEKQNSAPTPTP